MRTYLRSANEVAARQIPERFRRCRGLLYFMAYRVLREREAAQQAVHACLIKASQNPPKFESEIAFRSWLLRILISEAFQILRQRKQAAVESAEEMFAGHH